jgi:hypothetical protein
MRMFPSDHIMDIGSVTPFSFSNNGTKYSTEIQGYHYPIFRNTLPPGIVIGIEVCPGAINGIF